MTPDKRELLPCPFCGSAVTLDTSYDRAGDGRVRCNECHASMERSGFNGSKVVTEAWNRRTDREGFVTVPIERLEEIVSALDRGLGDSDITHIESDEELKEEEPIQWACSQLNYLIAAAPKEGE